LDATISPAAAAAAAETRRLRERRDDPHTMSGRQMLPRLISRQPPEPPDAPAPACWPGRRQQQAAFAAHAATDASAASRRQPVSSASTRARHAQNKLAKCALPAPCRHGRPGNEVRRNRLGG